jgi:thiol peroxidase
MSMAKSNEKITMKGNPLKVEGRCLEEGMQLPQFTLTGGDLADVSNDKFKGKVLVLVSIPSIDTPVCAIETKRFNQEASALSDDVVIAAVSRDLPFAYKRWCAAEGVSRVVGLSDFKHHSFGKAFGVELPDLGILARAVFIADKSGKVVHVDYVSEVAEEPDYAAALAAIKRSL